MNLFRNIETDAVGMVRLFLFKVNAPQLKNLHASGQKGGVDTLKD